ncbi:MAG: citrate/2-methylcitrate synthase [Acidimicrobiales bacterium]
MTTNPDRSRPRNPDRSRPRNLDRSGPPIASAEVRDLIANTLDIERGEVTPELRLHDLPEWSSLDHVTLMMALEDRFDCAIEGPLIGELTCVEAIEAFLLDEKGLDETALDGPVIHRGLDGVYVDESTICSIDGEQGELLVRGYPIEDIAAHSGFEEVCHLVVWDERPSEEKLVAFREQLAEGAAIADPVATTVESMADQHPMVVLRTAVSMLGTSGPGTRPTAEAAREKGLAVLALVPSILATHHAARLGRPRPDGCPEGASLAERFLRQFFDRDPSAIEVEALDLVLRVQVEHGSNASAFAARVTAATGADVVAGLVSGVSTFAGPLHGGAVEGFIDVLDEVGELEAARAYVMAKRAAREPVPGFGHRVYKTTDPRSQPLRSTAERLAADRGDRRTLEVIAAIEQAMAPYQRHGLHMNIDAYTAVVYRLLGFPDDYFSALYAMARMAGWVGHIAEQIDRNVLIRPRLAYRGPARRSMLVVS